MLNVLGNLGQFPIQGQRQGDVETKPFVLIFSPDTATMGFDKPLANRKSQTGARHLIRFGDAEEFIKNMSEMFFRHRRALIDHLYQQPVLLLLQP